MGLRSKEINTWLEYNHRGCEQEQWALGANKVDIKYNMMMK